MANMVEIEKKEIKTIAFNEEMLLLTFIDDTKIKITDQGQSCCEHRYLHTDDDLNYFVGSMLLAGDIRNAPNITDDDMEVHEIQFLIITTSKGQFTIETHNEHNGYYGGFDLVVEVISNG